MRKMLVVFLGLFLGLVVTAGRAGASEGFDELAQLIKSGVDDNVILAFIDKSAVAYDLNGDEVVYLNDLGVSPQVFAAVVQHGKDLREKGVPAAPPPPAPAAREPEAVSPAIGRPVPTVEPATVPAIREIVVAPTVVAPPPEGVNVSFLYEAMTPYGTWITVDNNWVWQPTVVLMDHEWQPYFHRGHWVWTDYGWCWQSDYSWGWAAFHYGRWSHHGVYGWVWMPDTVWGPAWVSWRSSDEHWGWAPLPFGCVFEAGLGFRFGGVHVGLDFDFGLRDRDFCFVEHRHFADSMLHRYAVPRTQVVNIYNKTTIIQKNYTYNDNRIINNGPGIERVRVATKHDFKEVKLVDADIKAGQQIHGARLQGNTLAVYRPHVDSKAPDAPPAVVARQQKAMVAREAAEARRDVRKDAAEVRRDVRKDATEARKDARADAAVERRENVEATQEARRQQLAAEKAAKDHDRAAADANTERKRLEKLADKEADAKKKDELTTQAREARIREADAKKAKRDAEAAAEDQKKAAEAAEKEQERAAKLKEKESKKTSAVETERAVSREVTAKTDVPAKADVAADRKAKLAAEEAARDAAADARKAKLAAEAAAREQAQRDAAITRTKTSSDSEALPGRGAAASKTPPPSESARVEARKAPVTPPATTESDDQTTKKKKKGRKDEDN